MSVMDEGDRFLTVDEQKGLFNVLNEEQQRVAFESYVETLTPEGRVAFFKKAKERWDQAEKADKTQKKRKKEIGKVEAPSSSGCESGTESRKKKVLRAAEPVVN